MKTNQLKSLSNAEILGLSKALNIAFNDEEKYFPAAINFFIQKNKSILANLVKDIETARRGILLHYGNPEPGDEDNIIFSKENLKIANKELEELLNVVQDIPMATLNLSDLDGLEFTPKQMQALLFMIEED